MGFGDLSKHKTPQCSQFFAMLPADFRLIVWFWMLTIWIWVMAWFSMLMIWIWDHDLVSEARGMDLRSWFGFVAHDLFLGAKT